MSAIHEHVLQNGMTLLCWPQRHLHGLEFGLYLKGGPLYETEETQGISNLLEHLCFRGLGGLNREGLLREPLRHEPRCRDVCRRAGVPPEMPAALL